MNKPTMPLLLKTGACALMCAVLAGCASPPPPGVVDLPAKPRRALTANLLRPLPPPLHFQTKLQTIFSRSQPKPTK